MTSWRIILNNLWEYFELRSGLGNQTRWSLNHRYSCVSDRVRPIVFWGFSRSKWNLVWCVYWEYLQYFWPLAFHFRVDTKPLPSEGLLQNPSSWNHEKYLISPHQFLPSYWILNHFILFLLPLTFSLFLDTYWPFPCSDTSAGLSAKISKCTVDLSSDNGRSNWNNIASMMEIEVLWGTSTRFLYCFLGISMLGLWILLGKWSVSGWTCSYRDRARLASRLLMLFLSLFALLSFRSLKFWLLCSLDYLAYLWRDSNPVF